jgi:hypothetical protein
MAPKKKAKSESSRAAAPIQTAPKPNWLALQPLLPEADLRLNELLPNQVLTIPNFWTATLCRSYVSFLSSLPLTATPGKPKKGDAVRVNDRFQIEDPAFAEQLWSGTALKSLVLGLNEADSSGMSHEERMCLWGGEAVRMTHESSEVTQLRVTSHRSA